MRVLPRQGRLHARRDPDMVTPTMSRQPPSLPDPRHARRLLPLLACALLGACAVPAPQAGPPAAVQAYVSAALLGHWCRSPDAVDTEACLSYLRGSFDTASQLGSDQGVATGYCIPPDVPVTELRARVRDRVADRDADSRLAAARMLAALWREHYPCEPSSAGSAPE